MITPVWKGDEENYMWTWRAVGSKNKRFHLLELTGHLLLSDRHTLEWIIIGDNQCGWLENLSLPTDTKKIIVNINNISHKRNTGLLQARGEYVMLLDADQRPVGSLEWLQSFLMDDLIEMMERDKLDMLTLKEEMSFTGGYLQRCYHQLRQLYWDHSDIGIPRLYRRNVIGGIFFDEKHLHFEDLDFYSNVISRVGKEGRAGIFPCIYHHEKFSFWKTMRKARIAHLQSRVHRVNSVGRISLKDLLRHTPYSYLPGVLFLLITKMVAKRFLPVAEGTPR